MAVATSLPTTVRRPNIAPPTTFVSLTDADLVRMSDEELIEFADKVLSIVIPWGTKRTTILTRIVNSAVVARDGR